MGNYDDEDEDYYDEDDEEEGSDPMVLMVGKDGVLQIAPEMVQIPKADAELLDAFLKENPDVSERLKAFGDAQQQSDVVKDELER